ncbi:WPP domain-interacting tail-anchored protein 1-like [Oryza brachyantha]|uniref:WIT1/2 N-terminal helical bundle domain-containing protein n=1 Tax=Oryza brachyantha TaxID=4533 RepID=J3KY22_ORYBR|nr:WPP domain-interacting tail-anchored protein 1-like [Oryza brachyantha]
MDIESIQEGDFYLREKRGDGRNGEGATEVLTRVELGVAFGSEKLLNLEILLMQIAHRATEIEPLVLDAESISAESAEKVSEFDLLCCILDSEVTGLENFVGSIEMDIGNAAKMASDEDSVSGVSSKLQDATVPLKQMQDLISAIRSQSANFNKLIDTSHDNSGASEDGGYENGHVSSHSAMHSEGKRNILQMLDQSMASELDLGKKLHDSESVMEELKLKLHHSENESFFLEESVEAISERMFAAENASELFLGLSKELIGKVNTIQFDLSASISREGDLKSKLEQSLTKDISNSTLKQDSEKVTWEALQSQAQPDAEFLTLQDKFQQLEEWLRESKSGLSLTIASLGANEEPQNMPRSDMSTFENIVNDLKDATVRAESRTQNAEAKCKRLSHTNMQLNEELKSLKSQGSDRAGLLEKRLKESDTQLEHAKASVEAIVEQQSMLKSSMSDMEQVIEDLKEKYLKAETRAENAESKCTLLTDTNLELSEELSFLRGRVESLENSLHKANQLKMSAAKDIGIKTKTITDLVAKLALERERLHLQIVTLTKKNKILAQKCKENINEVAPVNNKVTANEGEERPTKVIEETVPDSSPTQTKVKRTAENLGEEEDEMTAPLEDKPGACSTIDTIPVRSIEPTVLNWKCIFAAFLVLLAAALVYLLYQ